MNWPNKSNRVLGINDYLDDQYDQGYYSIMGLADDGPSDITNKSLWYGYLEVINDDNNIGITIQRLFLISTGTEKMRVYVRQLDSTTGGGGDWSEVSLSGTIKKATVTVGFTSATSVATGGLPIRIGQVSATTYPNIISVQPSTSNGPAAANGAGGMMAMGYLYRAANNIHCLALLGAVSGSTATVNVSVTIYYY